MSAEILALTMRNAERLQQVVWDITSFPADQLSELALLARNGISAAILGAIRSSGWMPGTLFLDDNADAISCEQPWQIRLAADRTKLYLHFETIEGVAIVPPHFLLKGTIIGDISPYLHTYHLQEGERSVGYRRSAEYERVQQHHALSHLFYDRLSVGQPFANKTVDDLEIARGYQPDTSYFIEQYHLSRRFFSSSGFLPRALFEFVEFALANYDTPFRAKLKRAANLSGYRL